MDPALAGDHDRITAAADRLADGLLALPVLAVAVGRVEVCDARVDRRSDRGDRHFPAHALAGHARQWPAAESEGPDRYRRRSERTTGRIHGQKGVSHQIWVTLGLSERGEFELRNRLPRFGG